MDHDNISIHGVREAVVYRSYVRVVWISICLACAGLMIYQCVELTSGLLSEQIATYTMTHEKEQTFPSVMLCPHMFRYRNYENFEISRTSDTNSWAYGDGTMFPNSIWAKETVGTYYHPIIKQFIPMTDWIIKKPPFWVKWHETRETLESPFDESTSYKRIVDMLNSMETLNYFRSVIKQKDLTEQSWDKLYDFMWEEYIGPNQTLAELQLRNTVDFDSLIVEIEGYPQINQQKIYTGLGVCYSFDFDVAVTALYSKSNHVKFRLRRRPLERYWHTSATESLTDAVFRDSTMDSVGENLNSDFLFLGDASFWPKSSPVSIPQAFQNVPDETGLPYKDNPGIGYSENGGRTIMSTRVDYDMLMHFSSRTFKRLNLRRRPCRDWSVQDRSICMVQCYNDEYCRKMERPCLMYHPNQTKEEQYKQLCSNLVGQTSYLTGKMDTCLFQSWFDPKRETYDQLCEDRCPKHCDERVYFVTHQVKKRTATWYHPSLKDSKELTYEIDKQIRERTHWVNVTLRFSDSAKRFQLVELHAISNYGFIANFGSAISLWTGASGIAIFEIILKTSSVMVRCCKGQPRP